MPSPAHENPLVLLREHPDLFGELLAAIRRPRLPAGMVVRDSVLRAPGASPERPVEVRPDLLLVHPPSRAWVAVEVQRDRDEEKQRRWPMIVCVQFDATGVPGDLCVLTSSGAVAKWARRVAQWVGPHGTRLSMRPAVIRLHIGHARRLLTAANPRLAFFAAWAVRDGSGARAEAVVAAALKRVGAAPPEERGRLIRGILTVLGPALVQWLKESTMDPQSDFVESEEYRAWREEIEARGREQGEKLGRSALVRALIGVIEVRGLALEANDRARVEACEDLTLLGVWLVRAATARSVREVFEG